MSELKELTGKQLPKPIPTDTGAAADRLRKNTPLKKKRRKSTRPQAKNSAVKVAAISIDVSQP